MKQSDVNALNEVYGQINDIKARLQLLDIHNPFDVGNPMTNLDMNGSGFQQAGMPNEFNNQSTGGMSPGQPMGEF